MVGREADTEQQRAVTGAPAVAPSGKEHADAIDRLDRGGRSTSLRWRRRVAFGGASEQSAWREVRRMNEAAFAPVRVPAGRQGGPRTHCAAGWEPRTADTQTKQPTRSMRTREDRSRGPVLLASWEPCGPVRGRAMVEHARGAPADVPSLGRSVPARVHAPARLRAALPGHAARLPVG